jgi:hypothetical protein
LRSTLALGLALAAVLIVSGCGTATPSASSSDSSAPDSGISGVTVAGPQCPVQIAGQPCPPRPVSVRVVVQDLARHEVATFNSDDQGRFRVRLPAGDYLLVTTDPHGPLLKPEHVTVVAGRYTELSLLLDTGIR